MAQSERKDQQHPLHATDRAIVDSLLNAEPTPHALADLARLRIRYQGFPGARDIQADLDKILKQWDLSEEVLYEQTRQIHATTQVYKGRTNKLEDWS